MNLLALLALFMLAKPSKDAAPSAVSASAPSRPSGARVIGQVVLVPLADGSNAIVAKAPGVESAYDAIVIARGTVYGSAKGVAVLLRCGNADDARAIADEIRGKF